MELNKHILTVQVFCLIRLESKHHMIFRTELKILPTVTTRANKTSLKNKEASNLRPISSKEQDGK